MNAAWKEGMRVEYDVSHMKGILNLPTIVQTQFACHFVFNVLPAQEGCFRQDMHSKALSSCQQASLVFLCCSSSYYISPVLHWGELFLHKSTALRLLQCSFPSVIEFLVLCTVIDGSNEFTHAYTHTL